MNFLRDDYKYTYISSATTTTVTGNTTVPVTGKLIRIVVTETAAGAITIYDAVAGSTTATIGAMKASIAEGTYDYGVTFSRGLQIVTAGASKLTVVWTTV